MSEQTLWTLVTVVGVAGFLIFGFALRRLHHMMRQNCPGYLAPQLQMSRFSDPVQADETLFARFRLIMCFALLMAWLLLLAASRNTAPWAWLLHGMMLLATAAWLAATGENLLLPVHGRAAGVLGRIKWGMLILWTVGMFTGLVFRAF